MGFFVNLLFYIATFIITELLRPKTPDAKPTAFEDFGFPSVDPGRRIPIIWGKERIDSIHTLDVMFFEAAPIRKRTGLFNKSTVGFKYYVGIDVGLARSGCTLRRIFFDDQVVWEGTAAPADDGVSFVIENSRFFGGDDGGGGFGGTVVYWGGGPTQNTSTYGANYQNPQPAYRHVSRIEFRDFYFGNTGRMPVISVELERYPNTLGIGNNRKVEVDGVSPSDKIGLAIPEIIHEILTDDDWGLAESSVNDVNTASFIAAAATLRSEGNAASLRWMQGDNMEEVIRTCLIQADGALFKRASDGKWTLNLARRDYLVSPLTIPTYDKTNCTLVRLNRSGWDETFNEVHVNFRSTDSKEPPSPAVEYDMANFEITGYHEVATITFPGVQHEVLAQTLAAREIHQGAFPLAQIEILVNRKAWDLEPADVFRWSWEEYEITQMFFRVVKISYGTVDQNEIRIVAVQDIFGLSETSFGTAQTTLYTSLNTSPEVIAAVDIIQQPYFFNLNDPETSNPGSDHKPAVFARKPQGSSLTFRMLTRTGSDSFVEEDVSAEFTPNATLTNALPDDASPWDNPASVALSNVQDIRDIVSATDSDIKNFGLNLALITDDSSPQYFEFVAFKGFTDNGDGTAVMTDVQRGMVDTLPRSWSAGARVWFVSEGFSTTERDDWASNDTIDFELSNQTANGESAAITAALSLNDRVSRPLPPAGFTIGSSAGASPQDSRFRSKDAPAYPAGDMEFAWGRRLHPRSTLAYQQEGDDGAVSGVETVIEIYAAEGSPLTQGTLLRTITSTSNSATYTVAQQMLDVMLVSPHVDDFYVVAYNRLTASPTLISESQIERLIRWTV